MTERERELRTMVEKEVRDNLRIYAGWIWIAGRRNFERGDRTWRLKSVRRHEMVQMDHCNTKVVCRMLYTHIDKFHMVQMANCLRKIFLEQMVQTRYYFSFRCNQGYDKTNTRF